MFLLNTHQEHGMSPPEASFARVNSPARILPANTAERHHLGLPGQVGRLPHRATGEPFLMLPGTYPKD
jgi:hypothetical protein